MINVIPLFFNEPQDSHHYLENASQVSTDGINYTMIAPGDTTFKWEWFRRTIDTTGVATDIPLGNDYNLNLDTVVGQVGRGEKLIVLRCTHGDTGFVYTIVLPTVINLSDSDPDNPVGWDEQPYEYFVMPFPNYLSFGDWALQTFQQVNMSPRWINKYRTGGRTGDLDMNGVVNIADVIILNANFGNQ